MALPSLATVGQCDFGGGLTHVMCAHPKVCPRTGELFLFGHEIHPAKDAAASYSVVDADGALGDGVLGGEAGGGGSCMLALLARAFLCSGGSRR